MPRPSSSRSHSSTHSSTGSSPSIGVRHSASAWLKANHLGLEPLEQRLALTTLPAGFTETLVTTNSDLSSPTAMDFSPTGELWVLEQAGDVEFIRTDGSKFTALDLTVDSAGERGLLGIAFDPRTTAPDQRRLRLSVLHQATHRHQRSGQ